MHEFSSLPRDLQQTILRCKGVFLYSRKAVGTTAKLFQIGSFYAKVFFDKKMTNVTAINIFDDTTRLDPYLRLVDVSRIKSMAVNSTGGSGKNGGKKTSRLPEARLCTPPACGFPFPVGRAGSRFAKKQSGKLFLHATHHKGWSNQEWQLLTAPFVRVFKT